MPAPPRVRHAGPSASSNFMPTVPMFVESPEERRLRHRGIKQLLASKRNEYRPGVIPEGISEESEYEDDEVAPRAEPRPNEAPKRLRLGNSAETAAVRVDELRERRAQRAERGAEGVDWEVAAPAKAGN